MYPLFFYIKRFRKYTRTHIFKASFLAMAVIIYSVFSEFYFEKNITSSGIHNLFESLWWTMQTVTTVGYGDTPVYGYFGRINGIIVMVTGIGALGYLTAAITTIMIDARLASRIGDKMAVERKHIILCNYNETTKKVLRDIIKEGFEIVILNDEQIPGTNEYSFIKGSFLQENDLVRAGIKNASMVLIFSKNEEKNSMAVDAETILSAMVIKKLNGNVRIIGEIMNPESRVHAETVMDDIIIKGEVSSLLISSSILIPGMPEFINELFSSKNIAEERVDIKYKNGTYAEFISEMEKNGKIVIGFREKDKIFLRENIDKIMDKDYFIYIKENH